MSAEIRCCYAVLCSVTAGAAATSATLRIALVEVGAPHDALAATGATALGLLTTNALVALWPLALIVLRWHELPFACLVGDVLVLGQLVVHGLLVGGAIGQRPELWRFLPHLPLEWFGLALPAAGWLAARRGEVCRQSLCHAAAAALSALVIAAALETWAVPL